MALGGAAWRNEARAWRRAMLKTPRPNTAIALVNSVAEYCVTVWGIIYYVLMSSTLIRSIAMRTVSGTLIPTNINWVHVLSNIESPQFRSSSALEQLN